MCGIIGAFNFNDNKETVNEWVINQLEDQINRGQDGLGITIIDKDKKVKTERATEITKALLDLRFNPSQMIIMHHRTPTSSENKLSQTHPIKVSHGSFKHDYLIYHNGVIHNEDELKKKHMEELGFIYTTNRVRDKFSTLAAEEFNDSEAIAIEIARFIENQTTEMEAVGSAAFIALQINKKTQTANKLFFGRNDGNPLNMAKSRGKLRLSSEGEGQPIQTDMLYECDLVDFKLKKKACVIKTFQSNYTSHQAYDTDYHYKKAWESNRSVGFTANKDYSFADTYEEKQEELIETTKTQSETAIAEIMEQFWDTAEQMINFDDNGMDDYIKALGEEFATKLLSAYHKLKVEAGKLLIEEESQHDTIPDEGGNTLQKTVDKTENNQSAKIMEKKLLETI